MSFNTRKFGYAALAVGFILSAAPAFAESGGAENPSPTTGSATSNRTLGAPPPAAGTSSATHPTSSTRRMARRQTTTPAATSASVRNQIPGEATGSSAQGTPNSQPKLAPGAQQTNNPGGGAGR